MRPVDRLKVLLDPDRLAVAGAVASGPADVEALAERTGLDEQQVRVALGELVGSGLVHPTETGFSLDTEALRRVARELADTELPMDPVIGYGMTHDERLVLSRYFEGRTLVEIPSSRAKRLIVLERIALDFDLGRRYAEADVNELIGRFHPDWSTLRRLLVDEGFLDRESTAGGTEYWRSGGRAPET